MKIGFYSSRISFEPDSLITRGLGGSESAFLCLSQALKRNFPEDEVITYNLHSGKIKEYNGVICKTITDFYSEINSFDLDCLISLREPRLFKLPYIDSKLKMLWSQDNMEEQDLQWLTTNKYTQKNIDLILSVSNYSGDTIIQAFPNLEKITVMRNGFCKDFIPDEKFEKEKVAVYASTPYRGLDKLFELWPEILKHCRELKCEPKLKIFSSMSLYNQKDSPFLSSLQNKTSSYTESMIKDLNIEVFPAVSKKELYNEFQKSSVMLYPCKYTETSCMSVIEAISNGVWVVTTDRGALNESVIDGENGYLIKEGLDYDKQFINKSVTSLVSNYYPNCMKIDNVHSWDNISIEFKRLLEREIEWFQES